MTKKDKQYGTLEIAGLGTVEAPPDEAIVRLAVVTEARTAAEAVAANAELATRVLAAVSEVPNHGVTTGGLGVQPISTYDPERRVAEITGFRVDNAITVRTKVDYASQVFDAGIAAGANESSGIEFRIQNETTYREQALRLAVAQAFAEAKTVADAADVDLLGVKRIDVDPGSDAPSPVLRLEKAAAATPVVPGSLRISAYVRVAFRVA